MDNNQDLNSLGLEGISLEGNSEATAETEQEVATPEVTATEEQTSAPETEPTPASADQSDQATEDDNILNDLSDEETIDLFIEGIMDEKGANAPTDEIQEDLKKDLKEQLLREIDRSLIAELPDDKLEELNRMATANGQIDPNEIAKMIEESNLDVTDIVGTTMARFREIYLEDKKPEQETNEETEV